MTYPIKHIVIIFKENHAFDTYFGTFPGVNGDATLPHAPNPPLSDHPHTHEAWLKRASGAARQQYHEKDIPLYFSLAKHFSLCDNYFTDVAGPSTPNHLMVIAADSPIINNPHKNDPTQPQPPYNLPSLPQQMETAGLSWKSYGSYAHQYITALQKSPNNVPSDQFVKDAAVGNLPAVSWVYGPIGFSEHPVENVTLGSQWTAQQIQAIIKGGLWNETAIFVTWDDWGGWYDHVTPPNIEKWTDGTEFRYGSRVGCLAISPYAKHAYISKVKHSHVSLVKFAETIFGLPSLNKRTDEADDMMDCFDFTQKPTPFPKTLLKTIEATTDQKADVPLFVPGAKIITPKAKLVYNGGQLLSSVEVFTIFWGNAWQQSPQSDFIDQLNKYFETILTSSLMDQLTEYNTKTTTIGHGKLTGSLTYTDSSPTAQTTDTDIQTFIQKLLTKKKIPDPTPNTLYFVYTPTGVTVEQGGQASCSMFCGYHNTINNTIFYAVMPYPDCSGCLGGLSPFDALTSVTSHELCEAITDPVPGTGWYDQKNGEIGDICAWRQKKVGQYTVQQEWSNKHKKCL